MQKKNIRLLFTGVGLLVAFALWTVLVCFVDVRAIGPRGSSVGFATLNGYVHTLTGVNMYLYAITDWLGLLPIGVALGFALLGLVQWIRRKSVWGVDRSLRVLGVFYVIVMALYLLFESVAVNYRPVLINGYLEASYPSSTTLLVLCVMPTAMMQWNDRIKSRVLGRCVFFAAAAFVAFMVIGRLVSGVHWLTDILGGALLAAGLVSVYRAAVFSGDYKK